MASIFTACDSSPSESRSHDVATDRAATCWAFLVVVATACGSGGNAGGLFGGGPNQPGGGAGSTSGATGSANGGASTGGVQAGAGGSAGGGGSTGGGIETADAAPDDGSTGADGMVSGSDGGASFPPVQDFAAPGPFKTIQEMGGSTCTIFRPATLGEGGVRHPIIIWGNGTTATPSTYAPALTHWASHGFIVAAANTTNAGSGAEMMACATWVVAENTRSGSPYEGNVDVARIGAAGHSQGGGGTLMAGRDERIVVTAPLEPYTQQGFGGFDTSSMSAQKGPMFLMSGANDTIAVPVQNQQPVFTSSNVPTFWGTLAGADHIIAGTGNIGGFRGPATAWFRLHLMGDPQARVLFYGASCGLCTDAGWSVQRKSIP